MIGLGRVMGNGWVPDSNGERSNEREGCLEWAFDRPACCKGKAPGTPWLPAKLRPCPESGGNARLGGMGRTPFIPGGAGIPPDPLNDRKGFIIPAFDEYIDSEG